MSLLSFGAEAAAKTPKPTFASIAAGGATPPADDLVAYMSGTGFAGVTRAWDIEHSSFWGGTSPLEMIPHTSVSGATSFAPPGGNDPFGNNEDVVLLTRAFQSYLECDCPPFGGVAGSIQMWIYPLTLGITITPWSSIQLTSPATYVSQIDTMDRAVGRINEKSREFTGTALSGFTSALTLNAWNWLSWEWEWAPDPRIVVYHGLTAGAAATRTTIGSNSLRNGGPAIGQINIGGNDGGSFSLNGYICDVRLHNQARGAFAATQNATSARLV